MRFLVPAPFQRLTEYGNEPLGYRLRVLSVPAVECGLSAAGLSRRELDLDAEPVEDLDHPLPYPGEKGIYETCDEKIDSHGGFERILSGCSYKFIIVDDCYYFN